MRIGPVRIGTVRIEHSRTRASWVRCFFSYRGSQNLTISATKRPQKAHDFGYLRAGLRGGVCGPLQRAVLPVHFTGSALLARRFGGRYRVLGCKSAGSPVVDHDLADERQEGQKSQTDRSVDEDEGHGGSYRPIEVEPPCHLFTRSLRGIYVGAKFARTQETCRCTIQRLPAASRASPAIAPMRERQT